MLRTAAVLGIVALTAAPGRETPPARPSFSGTWQLQDPKEGPWSPFGSWFTATQNETSLVLEVHTTVTMDDYPGSPASITMDTGARNVTLPLHGETRTTYPRRSPEEISRRLGGKTAVGEPAAAVTRSHWAGDTLVIVTHTRYVYTNATGRTPSQFESQLTERMNLSMDKDGRLVVESTMIQTFPDDPPSGEAAPSPRVTIYYRKH